MKKRYRVNERFYWTISILILAITMTWLILDYNKYMRTYDPPEERSVTTVEEYQEQYKAPETTVSLGEFTITHYTNSVECCGKTDGITASGAVAQAGHTIAADPDILPFGTKVIIDGVEYTVEDTGGAIEGNRIDIFVSDMDTAINRGVIVREVFKEME